MEQLIPKLVGVVALIAGIILGKILFAKNTKKQLETAESQAQKIIEENIAKSMSSATLTRFLKAITGVTNGSENDPKARVMKSIITTK